ncbi:TPA: hypothetical protein DIV48_03590 [Candidatus Kaiserbacteria bacterium]|nr:MAG: hypothetical protein UY93_C0002G0324 [Parcubacteria group bacterium GW2011_GWA1_56_13]KKW46244.1 MAG: hypothetical protein UY97_C0008G0031 [Parcubacteria group bacterium GW2011_GWB1_57_6]HCR52695.1 hypothetical protein [Candidatus Kaiserbacteria bacterium]
MRKRRSAPPKKFFWSIALGGLLLVGVGVSAWLGAAGDTEEALGSTTQAVPYPAQYSDAHITENAVVADPRFKDIAIPRRISFLASVLPGFPPSRSFAPDTSEPEQGTWLWTPTLDITPQYRDAVIAEARNNGIRNIYLSIDSYLDIYVMPDGPEKYAKQKAFDKVLEDFIATARASGIAVDAEGGWRNWAEKGHVYKPFALLEYVKGFNAAHTEKFRGFQYDIEPYLLSEYQGDKRRVLSDYLDLMGETVARLDSTDLLFSVVIPYFYDDGDETPRFVYGLRAGYALDHLFAILERRPGSKLIVMAYRNHSDGADGSVEISRGEMKMSERFATKVVIAQETGDVTPSFVTFYNTSRSRLNAQLQNIHDAFAENKRYDGTAIHYLNALLALK